MISYTYWSNGLWLQVTVEQPWRIAPTRESVKPSHFPYGAVVRQLPKVLAQSFIILKMAKPYHIWIGRQFVTFSYTWVMPPLDLIYRHWFYICIILNSGLSLIYVPWLWSSIHAVNMSPLLAYILDLNGAQHVLSGSFATGDEIEWASSCFFRHGITHHPIMR